MPQIMTRSTLRRARQLWQGADHARRKQMIVEVGIELLKRKGLKGVSIRAVAEKLGVGAMTLYTYIDGQDGLRLAMTQYGFDLMASGCREASTLGTPRGWRGGANHYLRFAVENPHLYKLMFATRIDQSAADEQILRRGFQPLLERVKEQMTLRGVPANQIERDALLFAGRYWIALHGLASLAIAGRLGVLDADLDQLLDSLVERVAPT